MSKEFIKAHGAFTATLIKKSGEVETFRKDNLVLNGGIDLICDSLGKASGRPNVLNYIAVGTSSTPASDAQTALQAESMRKQATYSHSAGTNKMTFSTTFNAGEATGPLTEAGICNASSGGVLFDRVVFSVLNKGADDILQTNFEITFTKG